MINKMLVAQLVGVLFAACALFGVVLPPSFTEAGLVETVMLAIATLTIVLRFTHGDPLGDAKAWYLSRTLWTSAIAFVFAALALFGVVPVIDQAEVVASVMAVLGLLGAWFGATSTEALR